MCELIFGGTNDSALNKAILYQLAVEDSKSNFDGTGAFTPGVPVWRTVIAAKNISNFGMLLNAGIGIHDAPFMAHVRAASKSIAITVDNVHPFEFKNLVGAHNGTIWWPGENYDSIVESRPSDSKKFLAELNEELDKTPSFVEAINNVMKPLAGKFAFLIYDKRDGIFYAVRGKTADLHSVEIFDEFTGELKGYIINTKKYDLEATTNSINNIYQLLGGSKLRFSPVNELKKETIFRLEETKIEEVGTITENPLSSLPKPVVVQQPQFSNFPTKSWSHGTSSTTTTVASSIEKLINTLVEWSDKEYLAPCDVDTIFRVLFSKSITEVDENILQTFVDKVIPVLSSDKRIRNFVANKRFYTYLIPDFFDRMELTFPLGTNNNKWREVQDKISAYLKLIEE